MEPLVQQQERNNGNLPAPYGLTLFNNVLQDQTGEVFLKLLQALACAQPDPALIAASYSHAFHELAAMANEEATPRLADAWQAYLAARLIDDRNPWSEQVERVGSAHVSSTLRAQARRDLRALQRLFQPGAEALWEMVD